MDVDDKENPGEDSNWNTSPTLDGVGPNPIPNSPQVNPVTWMDVQEDNTNSRKNEVIRSVERPNDEDDYGISEGSRARVERLMEEPRRVVTREDVEREMEEHRRRANSYFGMGRNNGEGTSSDPDRTSRRRRRTPREYLNLFTRVEDGRSNHRVEHATPSP